MKYLTLKAIKLPVGAEIVMTEEQARRRRAILGDINAGEPITLTSELAFKAGETIELVTELPKGYSKAVESQKNGTSINIQELLEGSIDEIELKLHAHNASDELLEAIRTEETAGKSRKGVFELIDELIEAE